MNKDPLLENTPPAPELPGIQVVTKPYLDSEYAAAEVYVHDYGEGHGEPCRYEVRVAFSGETMSDDREEALAFAREYRADLGRCAPELPADVAEFILDAEELRDRVDPQDDDFGEFIDRAESLRVKYVPEANWTREVRGVGSGRNRVELPADVVELLSDCADADEYELIGPTSENARELLVKYAPGRETREE